MNWKIADKEIMVLWIIGLFLVALGFGIAAWVAPWEVEWKKPHPAWHGWIGFLVEMIGFLLVLSHWKGH